MSYSVLQLKADLTGIPKSVFIPATFTPMPKISPGLIVTGKQKKRGKNGIEIGRAHV